MAARPVPQEELTGLGLVLEEEGDDFALWPENVQILEVFAAMGTQWNVAGMGGVIGLRYEALHVVMRACGVPAASRADVFHGVRIAERAALDIMAEDRRRG